MFKKQLTALGGFLLVVVAASFFLRSSSGGAHPQYFFPSGLVPDGFEYHLPAANLALHGSFPLFGFVSNINNYQLCDSPQLEKFYNDVAFAGTMVFPSKPPLYSFLLGCSYKLFAFKPATALWFNIFCFAFAAALIPLLGKAVAGVKGLVAGILGAALFVLLRQHDLWNFDAEALTAAMAMLSLFLGIIAFKHNKGFYHILFGVAIGLLLLAKGYFALSIGLIGLIYVLGFLRTKSATPIFNAILFVVGIALVLAPWIVHINSAIQKDIAGRLAYHQKLKSTAPHVSVPEYKDLFDSNGNVKLEVIEDVLKFHQYQHAIENGFVVISNQLGDYNILNVHNEFCADGDFHPEWRLVQSAFYHQHSHKTKNQKLWLFYSAYPAMLYKLPLAKLLNAAKPQSVFFGLAWIVLLVSIIVCRFNTSLFLTLALLLNVLAALIVFYGDIRFIQTVDAVSISAVILALSGLFKKKVEYH